MATGDSGCSTLLDGATVTSQPDPCRPYAFSSIVGKVTPVTSGPLRAVRFLGYRAGIRAAVSRQDASMIKGLLVRRIGDAAVTLATWAAATAVVMWCFAWVTRWYVVVGVLLVAVSAAVLADHANANVEPGDAVVPSPRDGESIDRLARQSP